MTISTKTRVSALLPTKLVQEIKQVSNSQKVSQSYILQSALEDWFNRKLANDAKALSKLTFNDLPSEDEWCSIQSKI